jgi:putative lipoprotein
MRYSLVIACAAILTLSASRQTVSAAPPPPSPAKVTGTVTLAQPGTVPNGAQVEIVLQDVSLADAPAVLIAARRFNTGGRQPPYSFELTYDPAKIDPRHTYAVSARISKGHKLLFTNDTRYPVITGGNPSHVDLALKSVP